MDNQPLSVFELNSQIKAILEETFLSVYVQGEVSGLVKHTSGHFYFNLKDAQSVIACVLFRGNAQTLNFELQNGQKVRIIGGLSVYPPRGNYQILCKQIFSDSLGDLFQAYEELKSKLENKGYFAHKKPLPPFPRKIAILTSATGAALQDMLKIASHRYNLVHFTIINTLVQGKGAKEDIVSNLAYADTLGMDLIVLARGGGSKEDLWAFNEEIVADAIYQAKTPVISAIGHQSDVLISDFVADLRAPTPSAAMELILPDQNQWLLYLADLHNIFKENFTKILSSKQTLLLHLQEQYKLASYEQKLYAKQTQITQLTSLLHLRFSNLLQKYQNQLSISKIYHSFNPIARFESQIAQLNTIFQSQDPQYKCQNGYAQITQNQKIIPLEELKDNEIFELTNSKISKIAQILPKQ